MKYFKLIRISHWIKNLIVFLPSFLEGTLINSFFSLVISFFAISLIASSGYIFNDILDVESDRMHPKKCQRPIASGFVSVRLAKMVSIFFMFLSIVLMYNNMLGILILLIYVVLLLLYSRYLKKIKYMDILVLTLFYILRLVYGSLISDTYLTGWLVTLIFFSMFALSINKRYSEILLIKDNLVHRGYQNSDRNKLEIYMISSAFISLLIFNIHSYLIMEIREYWYFIVLNFAGVGMILFFFDFAEDDDDIVSKVFKNKWLIIMVLILLCNYVYHAF